MPISVLYRRELDTGSEISLNTVESASLSENFMGVTAALGLIYAHVYDEDSTAEHSPPNVIMPVDEPATGRWILQNSPFDPDIIKPGTLIIKVTDNVDDGCLKCDGSEISRTTYTNLFAEIGTIYGEGDGSTTFNLPNFSGVFIRGWDDGAGVDPDAADRLDRGDGTTGDFVGTRQECEIQSHRHEVYSKESTGVEVKNLDVQTTASDILFTKYTGGNETRPVNINVMICIKY